VGKAAELSATAAGASSGPPELCAVLSCFWEGEFVASGHTQASLAVRSGSRSGSFRGPCATLHQPRCAARQVAPVLVIPHSPGMTSGSLVPLRDSLPAQCPTQRPVTGVREVSLCGARDEGGTPSEMHGEWRRNPFITEDSDRGCSDGPGKGARQATESCPAGSQTAGREASWQARRARKLTGAACNTRLRPASEPAVLLFTPPSFEPP